MILAAAPALGLCQQPKPEGERKPTPLTEEEKEMLRDRELLENLELLQMLDRIQYLELFIDPDRKEEKIPAVPENRKRRKGR